MGQVETMGMCRDVWRASNSPETEILFWTRRDGEIAMNDARIERRPGADDTLYAFGPADAQNAALSTKIHAET
jgi:hypothetical protein